jgi:putative heme transporter
MTSQQADASRTPYQGLLRAARAVAALLILGVAAYVVLQALARVAPVTLAVVAALLLCGLLGPVFRGLSRIGVPRSIGALTCVVGLVGLLTATSYLISRRAAGQIDDLQAQVVEGIGRLRQTLLDTLPGLNQSRLDDLTASLAQGLQKALPSPYAGVTSATEVLAAVLLTIVLLFFFLSDGEQMWSWLTGLLPEPRVRDVDRAGRAAWHTLASYTHGIVAVAAVDAVGIGTALFLLKVPLALSLTVLTFLSAFVPIVGATVAGVAATLVTLVTNGTRDAMLILAVVILVQQAEGNLLQPLIMRRAVQLHPVVVLLAVSTGTMVAGVAGALIAVPACAAAYHAVLGYRGRESTSTRTRAAATRARTAEQRRRKGVRRPEEEQRPEHDQREAEAEVRKSA